MRREYQQVAENIRINSGKHKVEEADEDRDIE